MKPAPPKKDVANKEKEYDDSDDNDNDEDNGDDLDSDEDLESQLENGDATGKSKNVDMRERQIPQ